MGRTFLIFIVAAGVLSSMLSGGGSRSSSRASSSPDPYQRQVAQIERDLARAKASSRSPSAFGDAVELQRDSNGHFYADVEINSMPIRVLVDTGASGIALSRDDARRAGLAISAGMFEVVGQGADGAVHGEVVTLDRVTLGHKTAEKMSAIVLDSGQQSLLGQSFLSQFETVRIENDKMILR